MKGGGGVFWHTTFSTGTIWGEGWACMVSITLSQVQVLICIRLKTEDPDDRQLELKGGFYLCICFLICGRAPVVNVAV